MSAGREPLQIATEFHLRSRLTRNERREPRAVRGSGCERLLCRGHSHGGVVESSAEINVVAADTLELDERIIGGYLRIIALGILKRGVPASLSRGFLLTGASCLTRPRRTA